MLPSACASLRTNCMDPLYLLWILVIASWQWELEADWLMLLSTSNFTSLTFQGTLVLLVSSKYRLGPVCVQCCWRVVMSLSQLWTSSTLVGQLQLQTPAAQQWSGMLTSKSSAVVGVLNWFALRWACDTLQREMLHGVLILVYKYSWKHAV